MSRPNALTFHLSAMQPCARPRLTRFGRWLNPSDEGQLRMSTQRYIRFSVAICYPRCEVEYAPEGHETKQLSAFSERGEDVRMTLVGKDHTFRILGGVGDLAWNRRAVPEIRRNLPKSQFRPTPTPRLLASDTTPSLAPLLSVSLSSRGQRASNNHSQGKYTSRPYNSPHSSLYERSAARMFPYDNPVSSPHNFYCWCYAYEHEACHPRERLL